MSTHSRPTSALAGLLALAALAACSAEGGTDEADPQLAVRFRWGLKIPMRDGVLLQATAYLPRDSQPAPCVFTLTPYVAQTYHDRGVYFAQHGYPFFTVDVRGRGNSGGTFRPMIQEAQDGYDVVEWLAAQPYCNGKVAMWGGSYSGYDQWATASRFPPHLATIVPAASPYVGADFPFRNNIFTPYDVQWLTFTSGRTAQDRIFADGAFWASEYRRLYDSGGALARFDEQVGNPSALFKEWLSHPHPDAYWDRYNPTADEYAKLQIPILTITGSHDVNQTGALLHYREHMKRASPAARAAHYLIIGPWDHAGTRTPQAEFGGLKLGPESLLDLPKLHTEWYDWTMRGGSKPQFLQKNVAYYVMGAEKWRYADTLDQVTASRRDYLLASTGAASDVFASGSLGAAPRGGPDRYRYDPRDRSGAELESQPAAEFTDQRLIQARTGKQLVYHTEPFAHATKISGFFKLTAWIGIDQPDTDFAASVYEIRPDGSSILLSTDMLRARYRESLRDPQLIRTSAPLRYDFDRFTFVSREVQAGSRLRLVIGPIDSIYWQKNYNSGGDVANETIEDARTVSVTLYHDRAHPSSLSVPLGQVDALHAVPLRDFPADAASAAAVAALVGDARVVALGEPAHGAHEPLAFRNRLLAYLVERFGFTAIALESGLSESRRVNDFILGGVGDAGEIARAQLTWGFGDYAENVELLRWLRRHNASSGVRKVRFYGIDVSGGSDADFSTARVCLDDALAYLERFAADASKRERADLAPFVTRFTRAEYLGLSQTEKTQLHDAIARVIALFQRERERLIAASSAGEFAWAERAAVVAGQVEELFRLWPADMPAAGVSSEFQQAAVARDAAMADNVQWAVRREGAAGRMLVYAHNAHIMNARLRGGIWSVYAQPPAAMGQHLREALGSDLVIVGLASANNGAGLPRYTGSRTTLEDALRPLGEAPFLLDLRRAGSTELSAPWLDSLQSMRANFTTQMLVSPRDAFDALVFVDTLTPARK